MDTYHDLVVMKSSLKIYSHLELTTEQAPSCVMKYMY